MAFSKKSQVTMFIILAIVILVIFSIFIIIFTKLGKQQIDSSSVALSETDVSYDQFNAYLQSCLSNALEDGLFIIGQQGGFIFENQLGSIVDFPIRSKELEHAENVSYNVTFITDLRPLSYIQTPPGYPCIKQEASMGWPSNLKGLNCINNYSHDMLNIQLIPFGYYQKINAPIRDVDVPLCSKTQVFNSSGVVQTICNPSSFDEKNKYSIQNQLEEYISYRLEQCFDEALVYIEEQIDAEVEEKGDYNVSIIFGEDYTTATLYFPLILNFKHKQASIKSFDFYAQKKVRFKTIYSLLYGDNLLLKNPYKERFVYNREGILDKDITNLTYDLMIDSLDFINEFDLHNITISRTYDDSGSLINVTDYLSELKGKPYSYYIRMWDRAPALDYIRNYESNQYDIYTYENESLLIIPFAIDPDDEGKQTQELIYEYEIKDVNWTWRQDNLSNSTIYKLGVDDEVVCSHDLYGLTKNRCTRIDLNRSDVGEHVVRIKVKDSSGLEDWQDVKIFVDYTTNLTFEINNIYGGLPNSFTIGGKQRFIVSREDPFIINTTGSLFSAGDYLTNTLEWKDLNHDATDVDLEPSSVNDFFKSIYPFKYRSNETIIVHPAYESFTSYDMLVDFLNKTDMMTKQVQNYDSKNSVVLSRLYDLDNYYQVFDIDYLQGYPFDPGFDAYSTLGVTYYHHGFPKDTRQKDIFIVECIPYQSDTPSYPYNLLRNEGDKRNLNPYYADHTCCEGDIANPTTWGYKSAGEECYSSLEIGTYYDFIYDEDKNISLEIFNELNSDFNILNDKFSGKVIYPKDVDVDKYVRELKGECTGDRGNICEPQKFIIGKIPYCGQEREVVNNNILFNGNHKVKDTFKYISDPERYGYYDGDLCVCKNYAGPVEVIDMTDNTKKELYCCFNDEGIPMGISDIACNLPNCYEKPRRIGNTPGITEHCKCGDEIVKKSDHMTDYCCKPNNVAYEVVSDLASCTIT